MSKVCVLMAVNLTPYGKRGEYYLRRSIESILCQTYKDFCFIMINDSDDNKAIDIANSYYDGRLQWMRNKKTIGLTESLNIGLDVLCEPFILRQDADDVSHPQRLEKLLDEMEKDKTIGAIGDNYAVINDRGEIVAINKTNPEEARITDLAGAIAGTSLLRTEAVRKVSGWKYEYAQDFYMWVKMRQAGYKIKSLTDTLYWVRQHPGQISQDKRAAQKACHREIIEKEITP